MQKLKVTTADLLPGMYVSQLDRPWLETPFLLHGFELSEESQLALLRQYCRHVYVDLTRSQIDSAQRERLLASRSKRLPNAATRVTADKPSALGQAKQALLKIDPTGLLQRWLGKPDRYQSSVSIRNEMPHAIAAYENAIAVIGRIQRCAQENRAVDIEEMKTVAGPLIDSALRNPAALAWFATLTKKQEYAYSHSVATSVWAIVLGRHLELGRSSLDSLALGAMLLDIGKVFVPEEILSKTTPLTRADRNMLDQHVDWGLELVEGITGIGQDVIDMIATHHERCDGSGYPRGLTSSDIPVFGQIAALTDSYDAMISDRDYAAGVSPPDAIAALTAFSGEKFDHYLTQQFVQAMGVFPSGSLVELNSGEIAIVMEQNGLRRLRPKILVLRDQNNDAPAKPLKMDLSKLNSDSRRPDSRWIVKGLKGRHYDSDPKKFFS